MGPITTLWCLFYGRFVQMMQAVPAWPTTRPGGALLVAVSVPLPGGLIVGLRGCPGRDTALASRVPDTLKPSEWGLAHRENARCAVCGT